MANIVFMLEREAVLFVKYGFDVSGFVESDTIEEFEKDLFGIARSAGSEAVNIKVWSDIEKEIAYARSDPDKEISSGKIEVEVRFSIARTTREIIGKRLYKFVSDRTNESVIDIKKENFL